MLRSRRTERTHKPASYFSHVQKYRHLSRVLTIFPYAELKNVKRLNKGSVLWLI